MASAFSRSVVHYPRARRLGKRLRSTPLEDSEMSLNEGQPRSEDKLGQIRSWASCLTAEERHHAWTLVNYVWPKSIIRLRDELLKSSRRKLVAVVGVQGVGKTSALQALEFDYLEPQIAEALRIRHISSEKQAESRKDAMNQELVAVNWGEMSRFLSGDYPLPNWTTIFFRNTYAQALNSFLSFKPARLPYGTELSIEAAELHLGKLRVRRARWNTVKAVFQAASNILIDMPDYSRTDRRLMVSDLETIQTLWRNLCEASGKANLVIFIQKEMFRDHFLFGKMEVVKLEPFKPLELVEAYKKIHGSAFPFSDESLLLVAKMSRGIFRRFLKYIHLSLECYLESAETITEEDVRKSVTDEQLLSDREEELTEIFPKSSQPRLHALRVMQFLETHNATNQKELAEAVGIEEYTLSRILDRLELHQKVRREKRGLENIVRIETLTN